MVGSAVIGALRVALALDTAQFQTGLKNAKSSLANLSASMAKMGVAAAAAGAAVAAGLAVATKGAIDAADAMAKASQKAGTSTEALSRLKHAADLSGVSFEGLQTGMTRLNVAMAEIAAGAGGKAKTAFAALGVAATEADGRLRSNTAVLADVADKFARMEDGALKTSLAVSIFGRSGADLLPMLNAGSAGLAEMAMQADQLGLTISSKTARASEIFNDNLSLMGAMLTGVANRLADTVAPVMAEFSNRLVNAITNSGILNAAVQALTWVFQQLAKGGLLVTTTISAISEAAWTTGKALQHIFAGDWTGAMNAVNIGAGTIRDQFAAMAADMAAIDFGTFGDSAVAATEKARAGFEAMAVDLKDVAEGVKKAQQTTSDAMGGIASNITGALQNIFGEHKIFAAAEIGISTAQAIMKTLATGGAWAMPQALAIGALGATQLAKVMSTQPGSVSMPSAGGGSVPAVVEPPALQQQRAVNITLHGDSFRASDIRSLMDQLAEGLNSSDSGDRFNVAIRNTVR